MSEEKKDALSSVISYALVADHQRHNLRRGLSAHSEHYAYEQILPRLDPRWRSLETVAVRLAAVIADSRIPQNGDLSLGAWLSKNGGGNGGVDIRLKQMLRQDAPEAVVNISRILKVVNSNQGFDWYGLGRTLIFWGDGLTERSLSTRQSILRDFYISKDMQAVIPMAENSDIEVEDEDRKETI